MSVRAVPGMVSPPVRICEVLPAFFRTRGLVPVAPAETTPDEISAEIQHRGYLTRRAVAGHAGAGHTGAGAAGPAPDLVVVIIAAGSKYAGHSADLRQLISYVASGRGGAGAAPGEVIVAAPEETLAKKNLLDAVRTAAEDAAPVLVSMHSYGIFGTDLSNHAMVPPHRLLTPDEAAAVLAAGRLSAADLPKAYESDPVIVWLGGRATKPPTLVAIERSSQTAGEAVYYRRIVKGGP